MLRTGEMNESCRTPPSILGTLSSFCTSTLCSRPELVGTGGDGWSMFGKPTHLQRGEASDVHFFPLPCRLQCARTDPVSTNEIQGISANCVFSGLGTHQRT